ncbi:MAG: GlsB/YeaQ/YmgE family stress response membrane protein [Planctomycetota bacterium]|nr:GlsB/YeaQ/YmgE family stress response membrane protein [Planctomycetota bacterium]
MDLVYAILLGILAGFIAGQLTKGSGFGWIGNLVVGALGALLGRFVFGLLGLAPTNLIGMLLSAVVGAIILLFLLSLISRKKG